MSSQSDRGPNAPADAAEPSSATTDTQSSGAGAESPTSESGGVQSSTTSHGESPGAPRVSAIRIGTQRYGVKAPPAVAKPLLPLPSLGSVEPPAAESTAHSPAQPAPAPGPEPSRAESPAPTSPHAESTVEQPFVASSREATAAGAPGAAPPNRARRRDEAKSRAPKIIEEQSHKSKVPPPSTRGELPPDLELEYLEALGGQPLEEIIAKETTAPVADLEPESRHRGKVISVHRDNVFVEIGGRQQGVLPLKNFVEPPEPGAVLDVMVSRFNPADGYYELVAPGGAVDVGDWSEVAEGMIVEARVTGHNKGGLECEVNRLRGFIPASQISMYRVDDLAQFVDQKFPCVVTEVNPEKRNLVLSHRAVLEREKAEAKEKLMAELAPGQEREGIVRSLQSFGAFVDLGGVDGLVHISQLSWDRIKHADEVLQLGQKIKVKIQKIDPQTGKIGLGFRDLAENPWANAARDFPTRSLVKGTVSRLMEFGAFVRLAPGVEGLVHISELSHKRVFRVSDILAEGQEVEVMVLSVDAEQQRISLSLKALEARASAAGKDAAAEEADEPDAPPEPPKQRKTPLKGGIGGPSSGEKFGLKW
jgi:predicted RNA-binding protein with RPS1 domain